MSGFRSGRYPSFGRPNEPNTTDLVKGIDELSLQTEVDVEEPTIKDAIIDAQMEKELKQQSNKDLVKEVDIEENADEDLVEILKEETDDTGKKIKITDDDDIPILEKDSYDAEAIKIVFGDKNTNEARFIINSNSRTAKIIECLQLAEDALNLPPSTPRTIEEALTAGPYTAKWRQAMSEEFDEILVRGTSNLIPNINTLNESNYVFRVTLHDDGTFKFRFRFVARGCSPTVITAGIDEI